MKGDQADPTTRRQILFQTQPFANHNGGQVTIGPDDMLYIGFGDGGSANRREGKHPYNDGTQPRGGRDPILERAHSLGDCAVIGGYVYRDKVIPALNGAYVYGDLCTGALRAAVQSAGVISQERALGLTVANLVSFGEGPAGELFAISGGGTVYRIAPA